VETSRSADCQRNTEHVAVERPASAPLDGSCSSESETGSETDTDSETASSDFTDFEDAPAAEANDTKGADAQLVVDTSGAACGTVTPPTSPHDLFLVPASGGASEQPACDAEDSEFEDSSSESEFEVEEPAKPVFVQDLEPTQSRPTQSPSPAERSASCQVEQLGTVVAQDNISKTLSQSAVPPVNAQGCSGTESVDTPASACFSSSNPRGPDLGQLQYGEHSDGASTNDVAKSDLPVASQSYESSQSESDRVSAADAGPLGQFHTLTTDSKGQEDGASTRATSAQGVAAAPEASMAGATEHWESESDSQSSFEDDTSAASMSQSALG